jgi:hypothetical protein
MRANQVTMQREEALKEVDVTVIGHNAVQQAGIMAQRGAQPGALLARVGPRTDVSLLCFVLCSDTGDYEGARVWQSMNTSLLQKVSPQAAPQQEAMSTCAQTGHYFL